MIPRRLLLHLCGGLALPRAAALAGNRPEKGPNVTGERSCLVGVWATIGDRPAYHSYMGYLPDFTINNSYYSPDFSHGGQLADNHGYPSVVATSHYGGSRGRYLSPFTAIDAANGRLFDSAAAITRGLRSNLAPYAGQIYAIRISREWAQPDNDWSPFHKNGVDPATWTSGWNNYAERVRAMFPGIRTAWDYPVGCRISNAMDYYPGDKNVDIISCDIYFVRDWYGPPSSCWDAYMTNPFSLSSWAEFARQHGKPIAVWEWGDNYGDGYCAARFDAWMKANNVVAQAYWNDTLDGAGSCALLAPGNAGTKLQYTADWDGASTCTVYTGSYWTLKPLPQTTPPGF